MPQLQSLPSPRLLVLESKSFSKPPPKTLHARVCLNFTVSPLQAFLSRVQVIFYLPPKPYMQEYSSTSPPPLSKTSCQILSHFLNLPPKPYMQEYSSTSQPPLSKTSCHDSKIFQVIFYFPPPKPYMQEYSSTSQPPLSKTSCHDSKSFFKPPPKKTLHARVCLNFTASPLQAFLSRFQVIF